MIGAAKEWISGCEAGRGGVSIVFLFMAWGMFCGWIAAQPREEPDSSQEVAPSDVSAWQLTPLDKAYLLKRARAALYSETKPEEGIPPNCSKGAGRDDFLTIYGPTGASVRTRSSGSSLADAVSRAAVQARVDPVFVQAGLDKGEAVRIKIAVLAVQKLMFPHPSVNLVLEMAPGLDGLSARVGSSVGYVLPAEIITRQITSRTLLLESACQDGEMPADAWRSLNTEVFRIRTISFMEKSPGGKDGEYLDLYRAIPLIREASLTPGKMEAAALAAGRWLVSAQDEDGSFASSYSPFENSYERKIYTVFRHAEATLALLQLCRKTRDPKLMDAAQKACAFLTKHIVSAEAPDNFSYVHEHIQGRLGPAALTLLALLERRAAMGDSKHDAEMTGLGAFLVYMQKEDGSFYPIYEFKKRVKGEDAAHRYYAGQALLALVRLYGLSKDEALLKAALSAADYIIRQRDADLKRTEPLEDHWAAAGLAELYPITGDLSHAEYCFAIAETIRLHQLGRDRTPFLDYIGGSDEGTDAGNPPGVSSTAARCIGMAAAAALAAQMNVKTEDYRESLAGMIRFILQNQYTPENSYYLPDAQKALGGFRASFIEHNIELPCVARTLSALLSAPAE